MLWKLFSKYFLLCIQSYVLISSAMTMCFAYLKSFSLVDAVWILSLNFCIFINFQHFFFKKNNCFYNCSAFFQNQSVILHMTKFELYYSLYTRILYKYTIHLLKLYRRSFAPEEYDLSNGYTYKYQWKQPIFNFLLSLITLKQMKIVVRNTTKKYHKNFKFELNFRHKVVTELYNIPALGITF